MKKLRVFILAAVCVLTAAFACACGQEPNYYRLSFKEIDGITYVQANDIPLGADIRSGVTVKFKVEIDREKLTGDPKVKANGRTLKADGEGAYSVTVTSDTEITVDGVSNLNRYEVTFDAGELRTRFTDVNGNPLTKLTADVNEQVRFKVITSSYYVGEPRVSVNTTVLSPDANGVYTATITNTSTITVTNLEIDTPYRGRADGGNGTAQNPYKISRPIDLYAMADDVSGTFYLNARYEYYELVNDIDLGGEQLYVIGDGTGTEQSGPSFFAGIFEGNGYTIKNFRIEDSIIEQNTYTRVYLPYLGMFGYVTGSSLGKARISNVNLTDFTMHVNTSHVLGDVTVGGIVGFAAGADISGCTVNGDIVIDASTEIREGQYCRTYVGGVVGAMAQYVAGSYGLASSLRSCVNNGSITVQSGNAMAVGGIAGNLAAYSEQLPSSVINCYNTADITGGYNVGGIVGAASPCVAIENCYNIGNISAATELRAGFGYDGLAHAGGIAGTVSFGSVIANSFSCGSVTATSLDDDWFAYSDDIAGGAQTAGTVYESSKNSIIHEDAVIANCHANPEVSEDFYKNVLHWDDGDWLFNGDYPTVNFNPTSITFNVNIVAGGETLKTVAITDRYEPLVRWFDTEGGVPEFVAKNTQRSYGYYFDAALKNKVPSSYVPAGNVTLYARLVDVADITGVYAVAVSNPASGGTAYITLAADGSLRYEYGARNGASYYSYDGSRIVLTELGLALHYAGSTNQSVDAYEAVVNSDGNLNIYNSASKLASRVDFTAVKVAPEFAYGEYKVNDVIYEFKKDGTGVRTEGNTTAAFTYTVNLNGEIKFTAGGIEYTAVAANGSITDISAVAAVKLDAFAGVWNRSALQLVRYKFDGLGNYVYLEYGYNGGAEVEISRSSGTYTVNGDEAELSGGKGSAVFDSSGRLVIGGETYCLGDELRGTWMFNSHSALIELTFNGIGRNGYGTASADLGNGEDIELTYGIAGGEVSLYLNEFTFGLFRYSAEDKTLTGSLINYNTGSYDTDVTFFSYDGFKGKWVSSDGDLGEVDFNGLGNYDVNGNTSHLAARGSVRINGSGAVAYLIDSTTQKAKFTHGGVEYTVVYRGDTLGVTGGGKSFDFVRLDGMFGTVYASDDGSKYTFDGRGNLDGGGTLTVSGASEQAEYGYRVDGSTITVIGSGENGSITLNAATNRYDFVYGGNTVALYIYTEFKGEWSVGKTDGLPLVINNVGADGTATGTYDSHAVTFEYNSASGALTFSYGITEYTVTVLSAVSDGNTVYELSISDGDASAVCIPQDKRDSYAGSYTSQISETETTQIVLDGLSGSYNTKGTAVITEGGAVMEIFYEPDAYGRILFTVNGSVIYIMYADSNGAFVKADGTKYSLVSPDRLHRRTAYGDAGSNKPNLKEVYVFDGVSKVYDADGKFIYEYTLIEQTEDDLLKLVLRAEFKDAKGNRYNVEINYGSGLLLITLYPLS